MVVLGATRFPLRRIGFAVEQAVQMDDLARRFLGVALCWHDLHDANDDLRIRPVGPPARRPVVDGRRMADARLGRTDHPAHVRELV
ncbi:MAG TPA: hypothetical protein VL652_10230 [Kutzneria sp.]|nr:hypothetical protein [Kutzneria sp.]